MELLYDTSVSLTLYASIAIDIINAPNLLKPAFSWDKSIRSPLDVSFFYIGLIAVFAVKILFSDPLSQLWCPSKFSSIPTYFQLYDNILTLPLTLTRITLLRSFIYLRRKYLGLHIFWIYMNSKCLLTNISNFVF